MRTRVISIADSLITLDELASVFKGKIKNWSQLKHGKQTKEIVLVFDNANSSNLNFIMKKFGLKDVKGLNIFSAGSNKKVIDYSKKGISNVNHDRFKKHLEQSHVNEAITSVESLSLLIDSQLSSNQQANQHKHSTNQSLDTGVEDILSQIDLDKKL